MLIWSHPGRNKVIMRVVGTQSQRATVACGWPGKVRALWEKQRKSSGIAAFYRCCTYGTHNVLPRWRAFVSDWKYGNFLWEDGKKENFVSNNREIKCDSLEIS
ncbi:hypothetical protein TNCV_1687391 [Trichonephila clavipes]|nr:hypothetical protein TNCV_1687391 [Trichonephila clavipes]